MKTDPLTRAELSFRAMLSPAKNSRGRYDSSTSAEYSLWARRVRAAWAERALCWWHPAEGRWLMWPPYVDENGDGPKELRGYVRDHPEAERHIPGVSSDSAPPRREQPAIRRGLRGR
jgi:hypothetical protein